MSNSMFTRYLTSTAAGCNPELSAHTWSVFLPGDNGYAEALNLAFPFFRAAASGRYSSRTLMRLANLNDDRPGQAMPVVLTVTSPFSYDEDTEVKRGGTLGMCVWWPDEDGRCLLAVTEGARRKKMGTAFVTFLQAYMDGWGNPSFWVGRQNRAAHHFVLNLGLCPTAINSNGAVLYSDARPEDGREDEPTLARPRRRNSPEPPNESPYPDDYDPEDAEPYGVVFNRSITTGTWG